MDGSRRPVWARSGEGCQASAAETLCPPLKGGGTFAVYRSEFRNRPARSRNSDACIVTDAPARRKDGHGSCQSKYRFRLSLQLQTIPEVQIARGADGRQCAPGRAFARAGLKSWPEEQAGWQAFPPGPAGGFPGNRVKSARIQTGVEQIRAISRIPHSSLSHHPALPPALLHSPAGGPALSRNQLSGTGGGVPLIDLR